MASPLAEIRDPANLTFPDNGKIPMDDAGIDLRRS
jgi:hypothetical protein